MSKPIGIPGTTATAQNEPESDKLSPSDDGDVRKAPFPTKDDVRLISGNTVAAWRKI